jgi:hypothetical protein
MPGYRLGSSADNIEKPLGGQLSQIRLHSASGTIGLRGDKSCPKEIFFAPHQTFTNPQ